VVARHDLHLDREFLVELHRSQSSYCLRPKSRRGLPNRTGLRLLQFPGTR
jgi:hypothetical protein